MIRYPDWQSRLSAFLLSRDSQPFEWGINDCALFSCDAILAITGRDLASSYRRLYSTQRGATRAIKRITGGLTVEDAAHHAAAQHDLPDIDPRMASRGDLLPLVKSDGGEAVSPPFLGILALDGRSAVAVSEKGLVFLPLSCAIRAWKV